MIKHFLKIGLRNLSKYRLYNIINVIGLSLGTACFIGIIAFAMNEFSFDKHHDDYENIFRLKLIGNMSGTEFEAAVTGAPVTKILYDELPEVIGYTRLLQRNTNALIEYKNKKIYQDNILYVDSLFFKMFNFNTTGESKTAFNDPYSIVFLESTAKKIFGADDPVGKFIKWNNNTDYRVKAVIKEPLQNSHIKFEALVSRSSLYSSPRYQSIYNNMYAFTNMGYIKCTHHRLDELNEKIQKVFESHVGKDLEESGANLIIRLQPVKDIHLKSKIIHELDTNGDLTTVYIFIAFAFLILIISSINYINLSIANSFNRTLEIGLRKMFGSGKTALILQFILETFFLTLMSIILSILILQLLSPLFNSIVNKPFRQILNNAITWWNILIFSVLLTILSGLYPSYFMSVVKPIKTLKGNFLKGNQSTLFMNSMIVLQFVISISLLCSTLFINKQINYISTKSLGFNKSGIVNISLRNSGMISKYEYIKEEFLKIPGVIDCSASSSLLGSFNQRREFYRGGKERSEMLMIMNLQCEDNFLDLMGFEITEGRNFYDNSEADKNKIIVNESLVRKFGIEEPLGKVFRTSSGENSADDQGYEIIGVCKDFHFASLHEDIEPLIIWNDKLNNRYLSVKINQQTSGAVVKQIGEKWNAIFPDYPFEYSFLEDRYHNLYKSDFNVSKVFMVFTILSVLIACLGIFILTSYMAEKRIKEIGIRKVLGAGSGDILKLISKEFVIIILVSAGISIPIVWLLINRWLENFAYKTNITVLIFVISFLVTLITALLFINIRAARAAVENPVKALRYK